MHRSLDRDLRGDSATSEGRPAAAARPLERWDPRSDGPRGDPRKRRKLWKGCERGHDAGTRGGQLNPRGDPSEWPAAAANYVDSRIDDPRGRPVAVALVVANYVDSRIDDPRGDPSLRPCIWANYVDSRRNKSRGDPLPSPAAACPWRIMWTSGLTSLEATRRPDSLVAD
jgi:hypothetical protein